MPSIKSDSTDRLFVCRESSILRGDVAARSFHQRACCCCAIVSATVQLQKTARLLFLLFDTPVDIIDKLNKEINAGLADRKLNARLADLGGDVLALSPADFGKFIADETEKWAKVIKFAGVKAE
jgi:hypothetical protein